MSEQLKEFIKTIHRIFIPPVHKAGWPLIVGFVFVSLILSLIWDVMGVIGFAASAWCFYFFRVPKRFVPDREGLILAPMAGRITHILNNAPLPPSLEKDDTENDATFTKITITPSPFDPHAIRFPIGAKITQKTYHPRAAMHSGFDKAGEESEYFAVLFDVEHKSKTVPMVMSFSANGPLSKIECEADTQQKYITGQECGHLRFCGHVDLYIPDQVGILCATGQTVIDGETVLADLTSKEKSRTATERA